MDDLGEKVVGRPDQMNESIGISFPKALVNSTFTKCTIPTPYDLSFLPFGSIQPPIVFELFDLSCKPNPYFFEPNIECINMESFYNQNEWSKRLCNDSKAYLQLRVKMRIFYDSESLLHRPLTAIGMVLAIEAYLSDGL